jgi:hypothetical protein
MPTLTPKRGAKPSPRSALAAASPHVPVIGAPDLPHEAGEDLDVGQRRPR